MTPPRRFTILALDGGGIKGTFSAAFLVGLEEVTGKRIVEHFDLIAGTSTGGIIAIGLGLGVPAKEILEFYRSEGPTIFPDTGLDGARATAGVLRALRAIFRPKHSADKLHRALEDVFGDRLLGSSRCRLVIPSFDAAAGDVHVFKTAHHEKLRRDHLRPAVEVALATSAAPVFLAQARDADGGRFLDGGVWVNSPAAVAMLEAITVLDVRREDIDLLSVGTTSRPFHVSSRRGFGGLAGWRGYKGICELFQSAQQAASLAQAHLLTDHRMVRIDAKVTPGRFALDSSAEIADLAALGAREARHHGEKVAERFLAVPAAKFVPHHGIGSVPSRLRHPV